MFKVVVVLILIGIVNEYYLVVNANERKNSKVKKINKNFNA